MEERDIAGNRFHLVDRGSFQYVLIDCSGTGPELLLATLDRAKAHIRSQPPASVLTLTDFTDAHFDKRVTELMKEYASGNAPYVRAAALVGVTGLKLVTLSAVRLFSKRNFSLFPTREEAEAWLRSQAG
jgi:hypothetical protein